MLVRYILIATLIIFSFNACSSKHKKMNKVKHRTQMQIEKEKESFNQLDKELKKFK